jgi:ATP-dependent DNA helicase RecQ
VPDVYAALKRHWGYDSFRPLQERIIQSLMGGSDVAVVMPTGGGKSLCYQLPALVLGKTVVVISPLIALMQDQVAQLADMGIPAAVLNSTQLPDEQRTVMRAAVQGAFRLIYLSPERLARQDTIGWLRQVPVLCFAIDEAHCISEWGHEFRPEYRQLSALRQHFPDKPIAAFTASATQRVRHDILHQLQLRDPHKYIASFHRANLRYIVRECDRQTHSRLLLTALRAYRGESVIVYAPTIATVEDTVDHLAARRIAAVPYHGQMDTATRAATRNCG